MCLRTRWMHDEGGGGGVGDAVGAAVGLTRAGGGGTGQQVLKLGAKLVATTDVAAISQRAAQDVMEELGDGTKRA